MYAGLHAKGLIFLWNFDLNKKMTTNFVKNPKHEI